MRQRQLLAACGCVTFALAACDTPSEIETPAVIAAVSGNGQSGTVGGSLREPIVVVVTTSRGNSTQNIRVSFNVIAGGGSVSSASQLTDALGRASVTWTLGTIAGNNEMTASVAGLQGSPVRFSALGQHAGVASLTLLTSASLAGVAGSPLADSVRVRATDQFQNPAAGSWIRFVPSRTGARVGPDSTRADADGRAATQWVLDTVAVPQSLSVVASGFPTVGVTVQAAVSPGSIAIVSVTGDRDTLRAVGDTTRLRAQGRDRYGNAVTGTPTWAVSDTNLATVSTAGLLRVRERGSVEVAATISGITGRRTVVLAIPARTVTVSTNLGTGTSVRIDGTPRSAPALVTWTQGVTHSVEVDTLQLLGVGHRAAYLRWSDGGSRSHQVRVSSDSVFTAELLRQFELVTEVAPPGSGVVLLEPSPSDHWYADRATVTATAVRDSSYLFGSWGGAATGTDSVATFAVTRADTLRAAFAVAPTWSALGGVANGARLYGVIAAYDASRARIVLYGGLTIGGTWEYDGTTWVQTTAGDGRRPNAGAALAYDAARSRVVLFGGYFSVYAGTDTDCCSGFVGGATGTWEYDGSTWTQATPLASPPPRGLHSMTYDSARHKVVLFGGSVGDDPRRASNWVNDTWEYDGITWTHVTTAVSPPARVRHALAYDARRQKVVLFGGDGRNDTWEYDGTNWVSVNTPTSPSPRAAPAMVYDESRGRTVLFGGRQGSGEEPLSTGDTALVDTWEYDGVRWTRALLRAAHSPGSPTSGQRVFNSPAVYDSGRRRVVLALARDGKSILGAASPGALYDLWDYLRR